MDDHNLMWVFIDFHNALITAVNESSGRWDLSELMDALKDHKLKGLSLSCARTINDNHELLINDKSKIMEAIKHEQMLMHWLAAKRLILLNLNNCNICLNQSQKCN